MASATVLGFAYESPVTDFPVRTGPGTTFDRAGYTISKGTGGLQILDIQPDSQGTMSDFGRVYQWFHLQFPDGKTGWMRGHVVGISGDLSLWGYGSVSATTHAYTLVRQEVTVTTTISKEVEVAKPVTNESVDANQGLQSGTSKEESPAESSIFSGGTTSDAVNTATKPTQSSEVNTATKPTGMTEVNTASKPTDSSEVTPATSGGLVQGTTKPTTPPAAIIKTSRAANVRTGPGLTFARGTPLPRGTRVPISQVQQEQGGQNYRWVKFNYQGQTAWIREDLVTWDGDTESLGLAWDTYPAPMGDNRWWIRGWNFGNDYNPNIPKHDGWDHGAPIGEPILTGPNGGKIVKVHKCTRCTAAAPSSRQQGYALGDPAVWNDPAWGWGYGNFIIVRYLNDQLPESTKAKLTAKGFPNGHLYVMYAHLHQSNVQEGQEVGANEVIATCGNTGNSEGPHVHLEVRASIHDSVTSWGSLRDNRMNPIILFKR